MSLPPWQQIVPVFISVGVIILIAVLRAHSRALAAITATMPLQIPLAVWIVSSANENDPIARAKFAESVFWGLGATLAFAAALWLAARAGWSTGSMILAGYAAWGTVLGVTLLLRSYL
jgi:hypothetical protein